MTTLEKASLFLAVETEKNPFIEIPPELLLFIVRLNQKEREVREVLKNSEKTSTKEEEVRNGNPPRRRSGDSAYGSRIGG